MKSRLDVLLEAILNGESVDLKSQSRIEEYLLQHINGGDVGDLPDPCSRVDILLRMLVKEGIGCDKSVDFTPQSKMEKYLLRYVKGIGDEGLPTGSSSSDILLHELASKTIGKATRITAKDLEGITKIGDRAFANFTNLVSVEIPNSVTSIGKGAFEGCVSLESISIPFVGASSDETGANHFGYIFGADSRYQNNTKVPQTLTKVKITGGRTIDDGAFYDCQSLEELDILDDTIKNIGILSFYGCGNLTKVNIPNNIDNINIAAFYDCSKLSYTIKNNIKYLGNAENPYLYCEGATSRLTITKAEIEEGCKVIGAGAFLGGVLLSSVNIPSTVKTIGEYAFRSCTTLKNVNFANNSQLKTIGKESFRDCKGALIGGITSLTIPNSVEFIGRGAFRGCDKLREISIPFVGRTGAYNERHSHFGYIFGADGYLYQHENIPTTLKTVRITNATQIGEKAFYSSNLDKVYLNCVDKLTHIGDDAFYGCNYHIQTVWKECLRYIGTEDDTNKYFYCFDVDTDAGPSGVEIVDGCKIISSKVTGYFGTKVLRKIPKSVIDMGSGNCDIVYYKGLKYLGPPSNPYLHLINQGADSITDAVIHPDCKYIDDYAFTSWTKLKSVTFEGNNVKEIGEKAFNYCTSLTSITLPESVEIIGYGAFYGCAKLKNIDLSKTNITQIPDQLFAACGTVDNLKLNDKIETIGRDSFEITLGYQGLTIPKSVIKIERNAFKNLKSSYSGFARMVHYTGTLDDWATIEFGNAYSSPLRYAIDPSIGLYINGKLVEDVVLDKAYKISDYAFYDYRKVKSVVIPDTVTSIGASAFENCFNLKSVIISDKALFDITSAIEIAGINISELGITLDEDIGKIKDYAFYNNGLTTITIPEDTKAIGKKAFNYTSGQTPTLNEVYMKPLTPPTLSDNATFPVNTIIYLNGNGAGPSTVDAYKSTQNWSHYDILL